MAPIKLRAGPSLCAREGIESWETGMKIRIYPLVKMLTTQEYGQCAQNTMTVQHVTKTDMGNVENIFVAN